MTPPLCQLGERPYADFVTGLAGTDHEPIADSVAAQPIAMSHYSFSYLADKTDEDKLRTYTLTGWYNGDSVRVDTLRLSSDTALYAHYTNTMVNITYIDTTNGRNDTVRIRYALSDLYNQSVDFYQPAYRKMEPWQHGIRKVENMWI